MKRILLLLTLLCIINLNLNALTMKEKIQQDLSKVVKEFMKKMKEIMWLLKRFYNFMGEVSVIV